ncbi:MAG: glycosyltransferase [Ghiorsea sp.]|nr:glycosyltransferase [Ghiorsea sp.]
MKRWAGLWRLKHALSKSDLTWFDSQASLDETQGLASQFYPYQIRFPAIEPSFSPGHLKREHFFLFVGNGLPHKNVKVLLQAIENTDIQLQCVGIRQSVADELCVIFPWAKQQVAFLQHVDDVALLKLYRQCAALLQPSTTEGYGYPPLEAFACGTPAIVSDITVLRETTGGFATFCAPHDWQAWQSALRNFQRDKQQVNHALAWAKQHQGKQGWAAHIQDIERLVKH